MTEPAELSSIGRMLLRTFRMANGPMFAPTTSLLVSVALGELRYFGLVEVMGETETHALAVMSDAGSAWLEER